jgi:hypothetical protein
MGEQELLAEADRILADDPWARLRAPFPASAIGRLPRAGTFLDYVGHAAVTDRLLAVDPTWTWRPMAVTPEGLPLVLIRGDDHVLWIVLRVAGVERPGVGIVKRSAFEIEKQLVSDAIRNAAMRFGVALDLWSKEDLHHDPTPAAESLGFGSAEEAQAAADEIRRAMEALPPSQRDAYRAWKEDAEIGWPVPAEYVEEVLGELRRLTEEAGGDEPF